MWVLAGSCGVFLQTINLVGSSQTINLAGSLKIFDDGSFLRIKSGLKRRPDLWRVVWRWVFLMWCLSVRLRVVICTPNFFILAPHYMHYNVVLCTLCALQGCTKWCVNKKNFVRINPLRLNRFIMMVAAGRWWWWWVYWNVGRNIINKCYEREGGGEHIQVMVCLFIL